VCQRGVWGSGASDARFGPYGAVSYIYVGVGGQGARMLHRATFCYQKERDGYFFLVGAGERLGVTPDSRRGLPAPAFLGDTTGSEVDERLGRAGA